MPLCPHQQALMRLGPLLLVGVFGLLLLLAPSTLWAEPAGVTVTDYRSEHHIGLEIAAGEAQAPVKATFTHYLMHLDVSFLEDWHARFGLPFSGYQGFDVPDNFVFGNPMLGVDGLYALNGYVQFGGGLRMYLPLATGREADILTAGADPRRLVLSHWHHRLGYSLERRMPISPEVTVRFTQWGLLLQWDLGLDLAPELRSTRRFDTVKTMLVLRQAFSAAYQPVSWFEISASLATLVDPDPDTKNFRSLLYDGTLTQRTLSIATVGPRFKWDWAELYARLHAPVEPWYYHHVYLHGSFGFAVEFH